MLIKSTAGGGGCCLLIKTDFEDSDGDCGTTRPSLFNLLNSSVFRGDDSAFQTCFGAGGRSPVPGCVSRSESDSVSDDNTSGIIGILGNDFRVCTCDPADPGRGCGGGISSRWLCIY